MHTVDSTVVIPEKKNIEDCYQELAHAVIRQAIEDQKIDINYHKKKLRKYLARPKKERNPEVIKHYKKEIEDSIEAKITSDDFMNNRIDLEMWIGIAFLFQLKEKKGNKDVEDFASYLRNKAKTSLVVRPY